MKLREARKFTSSFPTTVYLNTELDFGNTSATVVAVVDFDRTTKIAALTFRKTSLKTDCPAELRLTLVYDPEHIDVMTCKRFETTKTGQLHLSNPAGTHDDMLWALALDGHDPGYGAIVTWYHPVALLGRFWKLGLSKLVWNTGPG